MKDTGYVQKIYIEKYMFMTPLSRKKNVRKPIQTAFNVGTA